MVIIEKALGERIAAEASNECSSPGVNTPRISLLDSTARDR